MKDRHILAIETSCDETAAAVVRNGRVVLANQIYSQIDIHKSYGGVVPEIASRNHIAVIHDVVSSAMAESQCALEEIDAVAVTQGPGLVGALLVGINYAKGISYGLDIPLIAVNHIEGHICANFIEKPNLRPPFLTLVVSGGHTHLVVTEDYGKYHVVGKTRDDAAGEAFDKVARTLGLEYPGGPSIERIAKTGHSSAIDFPKAFLEKGSLDFSFSGLKSAVINYQNTMKMKRQVINIPDVAASFQEAVVAVLVEKTIEAAKKFDLTTINMAGGVASNGRLRKVMLQRCQQEGFNFSYPSSLLCTDNAAMIGCAGDFKYQRKEFADYHLNAIPNLKFQ